MHATDALDQGRLAGAVVAQQRQHLTPIGLDAHALERVHRPEIFLGIPHGENRTCLSHQDAPADCSVRTRPSRWRRSTSASTATTMIEPIAIIWKKTSRFSRLRAFRM